MMFKCVTHKFHIFYFFLPLPLNSQDKNTEHLYNIYVQLPETFLEVSFARNAILIMHVRAIFLFFLTCYFAVPLFSNYWIHSLCATFSVRLSNQDIFNLMKLFILLLLSRILILKTFSVSFDDFKALAYFFKWLGRTAHKCLYKYKLTRLYKYKLTLLNFLNIPWD